MMGSHELLAAVVIGCALAPAGAQGTPFPVGPQGGKATAILPDPFAAQVLLAATPGDGLLKSTDGGYVFAAYGTGLPPGALVAQLVQHPVTYPSYHDWMWAVIDNQIYRSENKGASFSAPTLTAATKLKYLHVGDSGRYQFALSDTEVYRSLDRGMTWELNYSGPWISNAEIAKSYTKVAYLGAGSSVLFSDNGAPWVAPGSFGKQISWLRVHPADHQTLYVAAADGRLYTSTDGAATFSEIGSGFPASKVLFLTLFPPNPAIMYVATTLGLWCSLDGGVSWSAANDGFSGAPPAIDWLDFTSDGKLVLSSDLGIFVSYAGKPHWTHVAFPSVELLDVAFAAPGGARLASGALGVYSAHVGASLGPTGWFSSAGAHTRAMAVDPADPDRWILGGSDAAGVGSVRVATAGGASAALAYAAPVASEVRALAADPFDPDRMLGALVAASGSHAAGLIRSLDRGNTWSEVPASLGWPVVSVAFDPHAPGHAIALLRDNRWAESADAGASWSASPPWPSGGDGVLFAFDAFTPGVYFRAELGGGLLRSADAGNTWAPLGLSAHERSDFVSFDGAPDVFWFSDAAGKVRLSGDAGASTSAAFEAPAGSLASALALDESDGTLLAGTTAASGWELPGASPYRKIGAGIPGTGGFVPRHYADGGLPELANPGWTLAADQLAGGAAAVLVLGAAEGALPLFGGTLYVALPSLLLAPLVASGLPGAGGAGAVAYALSIPADPSLIGHSIVTQVFALDPGAPFSVSASNGFESTVLP